MEARDKTDRNRTFRFRFYEGGSDRARRLKRRKPGAVKCQPCCKAVAERGDSGGFEASDVRTPGHSSNAENVRTLEDPPPPNAQSIRKRQLEAPAGGGLKRIRP
jgi:hypothetical protein